MYVLGENIKKILKIRKMSRRQAAEELGLSEDRLGRYIRGERKPPLEMLVAMSDLFNVSTDWLLTGKERHDSGAGANVRKYIITVSGFCSAEELKDE